MDNHTTAPMRRDFRWLLRRLRREYYAPTRPWSAAGINAYLDTRADIVRQFRSKEVNPVAVYDLRICANTFDFAYFLYDADTYFRALGLDRFRVVILDDELVDMGHEYERVVNWEKRRKRVKAILVPMAEMYQGCSAVRVTSDAQELIALCRENEPIFPHRADGKHLRAHVYKTLYPKLMRQLPYSGFQAPRTALDEVARFKARLAIVRPTVSLTVRAYAYQPLRNTDIGVYFDSPTTCVPQGSNRFSFPMPKRPALWISEISRALRRLARISVCARRCTKTVSPTSSRRTACTRWPGSTRNPA